MVLTFKLQAEDVAHHPIELETFKRLTQSNHPWVQRRKDAGGLRRLGVCPWCDNPIQLIGLRKDLSKGSRRPHGRHLNHKAEGFRVFDPHKLRGCPYQRKGKPFLKDEKNPASITALKIRKLALQNFDRAMLVLKRSLGINFSPRIAGVMLETWLAGEEWRYAGGSLRNIPWMLAYFAPNIALKGQFVRKEGGLIEDLREVVDARGQVGATCHYGLSFFDHRVKIQPDDTVRGSITMSIRDYALTTLPSAAPLICEKTIVFEHEQFERLVQLDTCHPSRDPQLREIAAQMDRRFPHSLAGGSHG